MKNLLFSLSFALSCYSVTVAQSVAIGDNSANPHASAILDLQSNNKGFLVPRVANPSAVASPANGLLVYNTTTSKFNFYDGSVWSEIGGVGSVTSVALSGGTTGLTTSGGPITSSGTITLGGTLGITNGGTGATTAAAARTNLGATTVGGNLFTLANPSAIRFIRINADNTVSTIDAATLRTEIGAGTGTVTGTGAANKVAFWTSASALSNNTNFHWDNGNGRLGIGNASPAYDLDVSGSFRVSANNVTGGGILLADDGSIVDNNDGYATHRFSRGIMVTDGNNTNNRRALVTNMGNVIASAGFITGRIQMRLGPGTGADNQWHTVQFDDGFAMTNLSVYSSSRFDGDIRINGEFLRDLLNDADRGWYGANGAPSAINTGTNTQTCDNCDHFASCPDNFIATGIQVWASGQLDNQGKLRCTRLRAGFSTVETGEGVESAISAPWNTGRDDQQHFAMCPPGTFVKGFRVFVSSHWDGSLRVYCTGITGQ